MSMRICAIVAAAGMFASVVNADVITQWNFNGANAASIPGGPTSPSPSVGSGTASLRGGVTGDPAFASGNASGGSSDPVTDSTDFGWQTTTYPAATVNNETAGVQFAVPTTGFQDITVSWDQRHSNTSSRFWAIYYTTDGSTWTRLSVSASNANPGTTPSGGTPASTAGLFGTAGTFSAFSTQAGAGDDWFNGRSVNFTGVAGVDNNPNFAVRILTSFDAGTAYAASSAGVYGGGTMRWDMVTVSGTVVPTPAAAALLGLGGLAAARRRRA